MPCAKKLKFFLVIYAFLNVNSFVFAADQPSLLDFPQHVLDDSKTFVKTSFTKENIPTLAAITAATVVLVHYDQDIADRVQKEGRNLNLDSNDKTKTYIGIGRWNIFRGPSDAGSALYFLGDGWLHGSICAGFYGYGLISSNAKATRTGYALGEGLFTSTAITQLLKHVTGRESPSTTTVPGGVWRFFPNQTKYARSQNKYNAYPSGHVTTAMMTITVISGNYPDNHYIKPVGYTLMTLLAFQMVNNGAHWTSDYPLALAIGYSVGKIAVNNVNGTGAKKQSASDSGVHILPFYTADAPGVSMFYRM